MLEIFSKKCWFLTAEICWFYYTVYKAEELRSKYEEFKNTNASNVSTLKGLENEFKELSKGVSQYGDNISLTTEQYERYKEIIQQIVGMSPSLAEGYDTENGYIADKNGLLERAIELQEIEYRNELRKITNLENLKTSMSGYIAEYKDALNGGIITAEGNIVGTTIDTDFKNSLWQLFNTNNRENYDGQSMAKDIMESLGIKDIDAEMQKYFNEYGYWQDSWFWNDYCDTIINNLNAVTDSLSFEEVGLDEEVFDQNLEKLESYAESYRDMKDSVEMANNAIQTDLGYIAEYADGYSELSTEQQKFVADFLKGFNISDITSKNAFGVLEYDNDKMASVKSQIKKFVEELSQDESTKEALADLYAIPTDEQSISEFVEQFRSALEIIKAYCEENGIEIPIAITDSEKEINELEAQYQRAVDYAKDKFDNYDPTAFFKENSINTQEEVDKWLEIAQAANSAAEAEEKYVQGSTLNNKTDISFSGFTEDQSKSIDTFQSEIKDLYDTLSSINSGDFSNSSIVDLIQSFPELASYTDNLSEAIENLAKEKLETLISSLREAGASEEIIELLKSTYEESIFAGMGINSMSDALKKLQSSDQALKDLREEIASTGKISDETINSLINSYPELSNVLIGYINNLYTEKDVIESLSKVYDTDYNNYVNYYKHKMQYDTEFYSGVIKNVDVHIKNLAKSYGIDLENCKNLAQAKLEVETKLVQEQLKLWSTYYSTLSEEEKESLYTLDPKTGKPVKTATHGLSWRSQNLKNDANKINDALDNVTTDFVTNTNFTHSNSNQSGSKGKTKDSIDWIERRLIVLRNALDKTKAKFENLFTFKAKNNNLEKQIIQTETLLKATEKAADKYLKKANGVKLSASLKKKVREGSYNINDYDSKTADKIQKYEEWYDKYQSQKQNAEDLKKQQRKGSLSH